MLLVHWLLHDYSIKFNLIQFNVICALGPVLFYGNSLSFIKSVWLPLIIECKESWPGAERHMEMNPLSMKGVSDVIKTDGGTRWELTSVMEDEE